MNILYLGRSEGTSRHRAEALKRLGHRVRLIDLKALLIGNRAIDFYIYKFGGRFLNTIVRRAILGLTAHDSHDLVWVDGGELVDSELVGSLRRRFGRTINYNIDDPFGSRDGDRWTIYQRCIPFYDLVVVMREINVQEAYRLGAKHVMRVFMSADEIAHRPHSLTAEDVEKDRSDVLFVGTWLPERGPIIGDLIKAGIPISIYGDRWHHAKEWKNIRPFWKGPGIFSDGYSKLIQSAKICLGLLSKGNRDLHTTRSFEIPSLGSVLLAERTKEHESLFRDGQEAVFWSNIDECIDRCNWLLNDEVTRNSIAIAGQARCTSSGYYNEVYLKKIIGQISGGVPILNARNYAQLKRNLKILYIGINEGTSSHRAKALMRLGHQVRIVDPIASFNKTLADTWTFKTGGLVLRDIVMRQIAELVSNDHYDLVWVNGGALIKPALVRELRKRSKRVINYNNDDPFGERDGDRWQTYLEAVPEYDLLAVVREPNVMEARQKGAKNVIRVFMSADEVIHAPRRISNVELDKWKSDVVFVGTWLPERGPFYWSLRIMGFRYQSMATGGKRQLNGQD